MYKFSSYLEQRNKNGDDALYIKEIGSSIWFCIADGAGGIGQGAYASAYIIEAFEELTRNLKPLIGSGKSVPIGFGPMYVEKMFYWAPMAYSSM